MAPDERARITLYDWMQETADEEKAEALMATLPPTHWPDLATTHDVELLRIEMTALEHKLTASFERGLRSQTRTFVLANAGMMIALAGYFSTVR